MTFLTIIVANIVRIARVMLPNPIEREIVSLVESMVHMYTALSARILYFEEIM